MLLPSSHVQVRLWNVEWLQYQDKVYIILCHYEDQFSVTLARRQCSDIWSKLL